MDDSSRQQEPTSGRPEAFSTRADLRLVRPFASEGATPPGVPSNELILRTMIANEIRTGRLTPARRRRVVKYAMGLGLTAVEAGCLIAECRDEALASEHPVERETALRLIPKPSPDRRPVAALLAVVLAATAVFKMAVMLITH